MPLIVEGNELEHIHTAPALLANIPPVAPSDGDLPILAFLASLMTFRPSDYYIVPPHLDLSQTLTIFMANDPDQRSWRRCSDTLMHYLHRGAFDALSDQDSVRPFLNICTSSPWWMYRWDQDQQTSTLTRERAIELKKKLPALNAAADPVTESHSVDDSLVPPIPEAQAPTQTLGLRTWDAFTRRLEDIRRWKWRGRTVATASDVEMALRDRRNT
ncbi:hypothetical protein SISNIDRAFT_486992 [Sistotremastrum niveocremeum HHB9708]|uniref:Uncharacterized protein n=1 Tax=Sistotremastrum niveocremeum HHB9708 TaxID=1314777 RepID=A0A164T414_9AGAM|nr:hypothetical protein SISNIDRAFT_486992 [Sistotremastrum niveocremeum HHB9708]